MWAESMDPNLEGKNVKEPFAKKYTDIVHEVRKSKKTGRSQLAKVYNAHERIAKKLEARVSDLKKREELLNKWEIKVQEEKMLFYSEKEMDEMAIYEQKMADGKMWTLAEGQKREKEKLHKKIIELEKKVDTKQALELEIERIMRDVQVMKHMSVDDHMEAKRKMEAFEKDLKDKEEDLKEMEALNQTLSVKERRRNGELQDARKELITGLNESHGFISVKRIGEVDSKPFYRAAKRKYSVEEEVEKGIEMWSLWEDYLRDPNWHPFKVICVRGHYEEIIDDEDEKLRSLKDEFGGEVYEAVTKSLREKNMYCHWGQHSFPVLWNSKEVREATLKEGVSYILKQWKQAEEKIKRRGF